MTIEAGIAIATALFKYGPGIAQAIATILSKQEHSLADWIAVFDQVKSYEEMDAESKKRTAPNLP